MAYCIGVVWLLSVTAIDQSVTWSGVPRRKVERDKETPWPSRPQETRDKGALKNYTGASHFYFASLSLEVVGSKRGERIHQSYEFLKMHLVSWHRTSHAIPLFWPTLSFCLLHPVFTCHLPPHPSFSFIEWTRNDRKRTLQEWGKGAVMMGAFVPLDFSSQEHKLVCHTREQCSLLIFLFSCLSSCPDLISVAHVDDEAHLPRPRKGHPALKVGEATALAQLLILVSSVFDSVHFRGAIRNNAKSRSASVDKVNKKQEWLCLSFLAAFLFLFERGTRVRWGVMLQDGYGYRILRQGWLMFLRNDLVCLPYLCLAFHWVSTHRGKER